MSESVDEQMLTNNLQKNKKSGHELPDTPSIRRRESCVLSAQKHANSIRQDSLRHNIEREDTRPNFPEQNSLSTIH